jgi:hypothetical protein
MKSSPRFFPKISSLNVTDQKRAWAIFVITDIAVEYLKDK